MQELFSLLILVASCSLSAMVRPPQPPQVSWNSLPAEVRRYAMQFIASSNVYEVAETMRALNATDKFCHDAMQCEEFILNVLQCMPYFANQLDLIDRLRRMPVFIAFEGYYCILKSRLKNGCALTSAVRNNKREKLVELLCSKNIDLNGACSCCPSPLGGAVYDQNVEAVKDLLKAGANPDIGKHFPFGEAILRKNKETVALLLEAGADPDLCNCRLLWWSHSPLNDIPPEIFKLIREAQKKRKERMRLLCGKKDDGCVVS
jgi:hypothetical protein